MLKSNYPKRRNNAPTCIDLFSGAGGLSLGFCQAGGIPIAAVDCDADSIKTYSNMLKICHDAQCVFIEQWIPKENLEGVDVIIGGPPCQGFSLARGTRFVDDPRNHLYKFFVKTVDRLRPKWIVIENVPGIISIGGGSILQEIYRDFSEIGYELTHKVINMAMYGVPQARKRTVFVGNRLGAKFEWPIPRFDSMYVDGEFRLSTHFRSVYDALGDLSWPMGRYFSHRANSKMRGPRNRDVMTQPAFTMRVRGDEFALCELPATSAFPPGPMPTTPMFYTPIQNDYQKVMRESPPWWIKDYVAPQERDVVVPKLKGTRRLTIREQARIQSFPDWFEFSGTIYSQARQIGNAVPPYFARQLFAKIIDQIK